MIKARLHTVLMMCTPYPGQMLASHGTGGKEGRHNVFNSWSTRPFWPRCVITLLGHLPVFLSAVLQGQAGHSSFKNSSFFQRQWVCNPAKLYVVWGTNIYSSDEFVTVNRPGLLSAPPEIHRNQGTKLPHKLDCKL